MKWILYELSEYKTSVCHRLLINISDRTDLKQV